MQLAVKAAGIADSLAISRPSPQGCRVGLAVGTSLPIPLGCGHSRVFGLDQGPVSVVHSEVEATGVAQAVAVIVSPPEGCGPGAAVGALPVVLGLGW